MYALHVLIILKRVDNYQTARTKFIHYRDYNK